MFAMTIYLSVLLIAGEEIPNYSEFHADFRACLKLTWWIDFVTVPPTKHSRNWRSTSSISTRSREFLSSEHSVPRGRCAAHRPRGINPPSFSSSVTLRNNQKVTGISARRRLKMYNVTHYESPHEYIMGEFSTKREFSFVSVSRGEGPAMEYIRVSADGVSLTLIRCNGEVRETIVWKMWKLMRRRRALPANYGPVTQGNLEWHADHLAWKVDR